MKNWYYKYNDEAFGPVTEEELQHTIEHGELTKDTLVKDEKMEIWVKASSINGLVPTVFEEEEQHRHLPIVATIQEAYHVMLDNVHNLWKPLLLTALIMIGLEVYVTPLNMEIILLTRVAYGVAFVMFTVTTHRIVLLGKDSVASYGLSWRRREWVFVLYTIAIYILLTLMTFLLLPVVGMLASSGGEALMYLVIAPLMYFFIRASIMFPAIAVEKQDIDFSWAMATTRNNGWRLVAVLAIIPAILHLLIAYIGGQSLILNIVSETLNVVLLVFEIIALSLSFKYLTDFEKDENENA